MTADEVKRLQVGEAVRICRYGEEVRCIVASRMGRKMLTRRVKGHLIQIPFEHFHDFPGVEYKKEVQA